jgi:hypothetical protein
MQKRLLTVAFVSATLGVAAASALGGCAKEATLTPATSQLSFLAGPSHRGHTATPRANEHGARQAPELLPSPGSSYGGGSVTSLLPLPGDELDDSDRPLAPNGLCPPDMASIDDRYCIDRYEASLVELLPNGEERPFSPFLAIDGQKPLPVVRAISSAHVVPQAYISELQAKTACARSGKRLCKPTEWKTACKGPEHTTYGYGSTNEARRCNDHGRAPMGVVFGLGGNSDPRQWGPRMNDPQLNQVEGTVAKTGDHADCTNGYGVYDMVGNVHEWVDDPDGTFLGGYYLDVHQNGDGCDYRTGAHDVWYHDYSTGFRCCADVAP